MVVEVVREESPGTESPAIEAVTRSLRCNRTHQRIGVGIEYEAGHLLAVVLGRGHDISQIVLQGYLIGLGKS